MVARIASLTPGYFAGVMATGIVSIGARLKGMSTLAGVLFWLAVVFYVVLIVLNGVRLVRFRRHMAEDFRDPARAFGFFTFIAATNVLGAALVGTGHSTIASVALTVSVLVWLLLGYVVPWTAVLSNEHRPMLDRANGTWFIWVVASQSIAVVAAGLEPILPAHRQYLSILAIFAWSLGVILYAGCAAFVALRAMLYPLRPQDLDPPYWVAMGAVAITVVAGARVIEMENTPMIAVTRGVAAGLSVMFWCFATWLIPVLIAAGVWRHFLHNIPLRYQPTLWSMVFPLGMYSVAGMYLGRANKLPVVEWIGSAWFWVALTAWVLTAVGMIVSITKDIRRRHDRPADAPSHC
ncbi:tellurite resistance/C4-dicarboxylate transporter family protein [Gordonia sp. UBA5067]|uniref:tellurite resistance/C4-dicarboxylate transporter family protein n=1 Tax=Gordonia sp. UBA5067 TaxID=1946575 RepID=UPI0025BBDC60|nr:tellurite resistance/C4-dicarboxylate transporter family protein [Gordonia sp. UBA5067]